ncbi:hypothetical protein [Candidatus Tisiphia endosymbiont of Oplodontha viridula]|uniref:hypothetical protein n=1 Tax=Candidatus Tisiphia endosymbiont of Oplodontha viridula TaxID=3077925 RepID=UPI0035C8F440
MIRNGLPRPLTWSRNDVSLYNSSLRGATLVATKQSRKIKFGLLRRLTPSRNDKL